MSSFPLDQSSDEPSDRPSGASSDSPADVSSNTPSLQAAPSPFRAPPATDRDRLSGMMRFAEELLRARDKIVMRLADFSLGVFHQEDVMHLPGIRFDNADPWMSIERLRKIENPRPEAMFEGWVVGDLNNPSANPGLLDKRFLVVSCEHASDLAEAGFLDFEDVEEPDPLRMLEADDDDSDEIDMEGEDTFPRLAAEPEDD
jgi:hypothetical protein